MTTRPLLTLRRAVSALAFWAALALVAAQVVLTLTPGQPLAAVALLSLKVALAGALLWLAWQVVRAMITGHDLPLPPLPTTLQRLRPRWPRWPGPWLWLAATGGLLILALHGQPARLTLTLYNYLLLAGATW